MLRKKIILLSLVFVFLVLLLSGCDWLFETEQTVTIMITSSYDSGVQVFWRETGTETWTLGATLYPSTTSENIVLSSVGTYDFEVRDFVTTDVLSSHLSEECTEYGSSVWDYRLSIYSSGSSIFY